MKTEQVPQKNQERERCKKTHCLELMRNARALVLRDSESFHEAASVLEHVGQIIGGVLHNGLKGYEASLLALADRTRRHSRDEVARTLNVVRNARNDAAHDGAWARHLNSRLLDLLLILEEGIMADTTLIEDIMVRGPVTAEPWHLVNQARRAMLANSFSCLPFIHEKEWHLLCDSAIVQYLGTARSGEIRRRVLEATIEHALSTKLIELTRVKTCLPKDPIAKAVELLNETSLPVLVIEESGSGPRLLGIVTAFDLL